MYNIGNYLGTEYLFVMTDSQVSGQIIFLSRLKETQVTVVQARLQAKLDNNLLPLHLNLTHVLLTFILIFFLYFGLPTVLRMLFVSVSP